MVNSLCLLICEYLTTPVVTANSETLLVKIQPCLKMCSVMKENYLDNLSLDLGITYMYIRCSRKREVAYFHLSWM